MWAYIISLDHKFCVAHFSKRQHVPKINISKVIGHTFPEQDINKILDFFKWECLLRQV